jgi:hypothetical protein
MTRRVLWVTSLTVAAVACSLAYWHFIPRRLPPPHLTVANLPRVPMQPSSGFIRCSGGLDFKLDNASGDWSVVQDHPPCDVSGSALHAVKATAIEMARVYRRPLVAFRVLPSGLIRDISLLYSSGSASLDRRALAQLARIRYPRHNCCSCRVSTAIDVDFEGPVWVRDSQDLQFLPSGKHFLRHYDDRSVNE